MKKVGVAILGLGVVGSGTYRILTENRAKLDELAKYLYEKETITGEEFMNILNKKEA